MEIRLAMNNRILLFVFLCLTQALFGQYTIDFNSGQFWEEVPLTADRFSRIISTPLGYHGLTNDGNFYRHFETTEDWSQRVGSIGSIEDKGLTYNFSTSISTFGITSQSIKHTLDFYNINGANVKSIDIPNDNSFGGNHPPDAEYRGNGLWTFYYDFNNERRLVLRTKDHTATLVEQTFMDYIWALYVILVLTRDN